MLSCSVMSNSLRPHGLQPARLLCPWDSPGKNSGVGCHFLLEGIFPTHGLNPGLLHCRWTLYCLCHQGSPRLSHLIVNVYGTLHDLRNRASQETLVVKRSTWPHRRHKTHQLGLDPWVRKIPWSRKWQPTPEFLPGKSQSYSPWGFKS